MYPILPRDRHKWNVPILTATWLKPWSEVTLVWGEGRQSDFDYGAK